MHLLSKANIRFRRHEVLAYLFNIIKPHSSGQVRVVIFAQGRTGSTLLESLLCSTGHFFKYGELLNNDSGKNEVIFPTQYIRGLSKWESDSNFIFHVKIYHLTRDRKRPVDPKIFLDTLYNDGFKVIFLRRNNLVRHVLCQSLLHNSGEATKNLMTKRRI